MKKPPHLSDKMFEKAIRAAAAREARGVKVTPTPERIAQAGDAYTVNNGHMRVQTSQLDRLYSRRQLDRDPEENKLMFEAGDRWRIDWYESGLSGLSGADLNGSGGGGSGHPAYGMPAAKHIASRRESWRGARRAMTEEERIVVGCIVLDEMSVLDAGEVVTKRNPQIKEAKLRQIAFERLRSGLHSLISYYGLRS